MDAKKLLEAILADPDPNSDRVGRLQNDLLREYGSGYPIENLRPLLHSENERLLDTGLFIADELGRKASPLLGDLFPLLKHPREQVRFEVLCCLQTCTGPSDKLELASAVALLDDAATSVRWKAMDFMRGASRDNLQAALSYLEATEPKSRHVIGLRWLLGPGANNPEEITIALKNPDSDIRKYAAVAAARISDSHSGPLFFASTTGDSEIKNFADHQINLYKMRLEQKARRAARNRPAQG